MNMASTCSPSIFRPCPWEKNACVSSAPRGICPNISITWRTALKNYCMERIRLIGRNSRLSLLQIDIVRRKIETAFPQMKVEIIARSSKGDALQEIPLHTVEGSDFFTRDIFDALAKGEADIAVHSLKDMSSGHFFGENKF